MKNIFDPCPFCKSEDVGFIRTHPTLLDDNKNVMAKACVICRKCYFGVVGLSRLQAYTNWNGRPILTKLPWPVEMDMNNTPIK